MPLMGSPQATLVCSSIDINTHTLINDRPRYDL